MAPHHHFTCPLCGECYFCLADVGAECLCEEDPRILYAIETADALRTEA